MKSFEEWLLEAKKKMDGGGEAGGAADAGSGEAGGAADSDSSSTDTNDIANHVHHGFGVYVGKKKKKCKCGCNKCNN